MENFPNLGRKIQSYPFCLKIGTHGILVGLIVNLGLDFQNSDPKIYFWANLCRKSQNYLFYLKIGANRLERVDSETIDF